MKKKALSFLFLVTILSCGVSSYAQNQVVVVPLISNNSKLEPINLTDVFNGFRAFTFFTDTLDLFTVDDQYAYVINTLQVLPENFTTSLSTIYINYCKTGGSCSFGWTVPNNTVTNLNFGPGFLVSENGSYYLEIPVRGGLPENVANQIHVFVQGYRVKK